MIVSLDEIKDNKKVGNKAYNLSFLKDRDFNVPCGFVLDSDSFDEFLLRSNINIIEELMELSSTDPSSLSSRIQALIDEKADRAFIRGLLKDLDDSKVYAVRSSSTKEDLGSFSFAGQYDTFLNKKGIEQIVEAVINCYKSLFSTNVLSYIKDNKLGTDGLKMAVIIQEMVDSNISGVAFTVDPKTGDDKSIYIEVIRGLGDNLVSGKALPECYSYNWFDDDSSLGGDILSEEMLKKIAAVFLDIQIAYGFPSDIEFAIKNDELFILQSRAITKIGYSKINDIWTTADFKDGGVSAYVCTPYMWSLYEYIWEYSLKKFVLDSKILKPKDVDKKIGDMFYGRPYWNLSTVKQAMSSVPGYKEREFDSEYGIKITYEGDGQRTGITFKSLINIAIIALAQKKILKERIDNSSRLREDLLSRYFSYKDSLDDEIDDNEFINKWIRLTKEEYLYSESTYFRQIFINTIHQSLYKDGLLKHVSESEYLSLLAGIDNISHLLPFYDMWDVTRKIREDKEAFNYWTTTPISTINEELSSDKYYLPLVSEFINEYGYHSDRELDVTYPCYVEDTLTVVKMFIDSVKLEDSCSPIDDKNRQSEQLSKLLDELKSKTNPLTYNKIYDKVTRMRSMLWWREEFRDISTRFYYIIRLYTMSLSGILVRGGIINSEDDIWMLKVGDLWEYFDGKLKKDNIRSIIDRNRKYYNSFRNFTSENEIGSIFDKESLEKGITRDGFFGLGCNNGTVTAVARVVEGLHDIDKLSPGDILVTKYTDTGWTSKFAMLSGIVTEYGGILCHAAIVSREYGIPCIVCATDAMTKIKDGDTITINGSTGEIVIKED